MDFAIWRWAATDVSHCAVSAVVSEGRVTRRTMSITHVRQEKLESQTDEAPGLQAAVSPGTAGLSHLFTNKSARDFNTLHWKKIQQTRRVQPKYFVTRCPPSKLPPSLFNTETTAHPVVKFSLLRQVRDQYL